MKTKHYILFFFLFAVIATKTYVAIYLHFSDSDIELSNDLDEEDSTDEEDTEKETSEKDEYYSEFHLGQIHLEANSFQSKSNHYYAIHSYISPIPDTLFSPPEMA